MLRANPAAITAGSVFVDGTNPARNFALNSLASRGAALRAANSILNDWPANATVGYLDIGAVQHQDTGGGGTAGMVMERIRSGF